MSKKIERLKEEAGAAFRKLREAEEAERAKTMPPMVGKCFVCRNSYGTDEHWNLYIKCTGISGTVFEALEFETTSSGEFLVNHVEPRYDFDDCREISAEQFDREWQSFLENLAKLNKTRA